MVGKTKMRDPAGDRVFNLINYTIVTLILLVVAYPMYFVIIASFSAVDLVNTGQVLFWPKGTNVLAYSEILKSPSIWSGYLNTVIYAGGGSTLSVAITLGAAFSLSRHELVGRKLFTFALVFTMIFGGGLIPLFLLVRSLGLYNTRWIMIFLGATGVWYIMIARTFFSGIPDEMYDSARIDGAGDLQYFFRIAIPLSSALVAVLFLFTIVGHWNSYITAIIFLQDKNKMPLQVVLREILVAQQQALQNVLQTGDIESFEDALTKADLIKYAVIVVSSIPVMIFYPFIQRYFVKGVMIGSLKA